MLAMNLCLGGSGSGSDVGISGGKSSMNVAASMYSSLKSRYSVAPTTAASKSNGVMAPKSQIPKTSPSRNRVITIFL